LKKICIFNNESFEITNGSRTANIIVITHLFQLYK